MLHRILLIEDEREWFDRVRTILARFRCPETGHPVSLTWASTEADGAEQIEAGGWSLIICDLYLSPSHGILSQPTSAEAGLKMVRQAAEQRRITQSTHPIIVLTQFSTDQDLDYRARDSGANDVVSKLDRNELGRQIQEALNLIVEPATAPPALEEEAPAEPTECRVWQNWRSLFLPPLMAARG